MKNAHAFSLAEIALSLGVIAFAFVAILGLVPVATQSARQSIDATHGSLIAHEVFNRIRTTMVSNNSGALNYFGPYPSTPTPMASFFYFDSQGVRTGELISVSYVNDKPDPTYYGNIPHSFEYYRAKVTVSAFDKNISYATYDPRTATSGTPNLLCATIEVGWPVNIPDGSIISGASTTANPVTAKALYTFFLRKP